MFVLLCQCRVEEEKLNIFKHVHVFAAEFLKNSNVIVSSLEIKTFREGREEKNNRKVDFTCVAEPCRLKYGPVFIPGHRARRGARIRAGKSGPAYHPRATLSLR